VATIFVRLVIDRAVIVSAARDAGASP
jgi:hypothetical protein